MWIYEDADTWLKLSPYVDTFRFGFGGVILSLEPSNSVAFIGLIYLKKTQSRIVIYHSLMLNESYCVSNNKNNVIHRSISYMVMMCHRTKDGVAVWIQDADTWLKLFQHHTMFTSLWLGMSWHLEPSNFVLAFLGPFFYLLRKKPKPRKTMIDPSAILSPQLHGVLY